MQFKTKLFQHQINAVEKLSKIKVGALYMEQGTGKTRTALELIKSRLDKGKVDSVIWLCPCSVKTNLKKDLGKHCDDISKIYICGIETLSSSIRENVKLLNKVKNERIYLVVDESNLVKNHQAKRTQNIIRLAEKCQYKVILNGTPISRCEKDLFAQWYILDWRILGYRSFWSFAANHLEYDENIRGKIVRCLETEHLTKKIAPYTFQVRKSECLDLPKKTYNTLYFDLTAKQYEHYQYVADNLLFQVDEFKPYTIYKLLGAVQAVSSGFRLHFDEKDNYAKELFFKNPLQNPRIECLLDLIEGISEKCIIFCKYTQEITDILSALSDKAVGYYGDLNQKQRDENISKFENGTQFLVANKQCAGYGLNLQFCSYIIYYNNDWDYATRIQSEDRVHRIGQRDNVHIVSICAGETIEERILDCLERKENLIESFKDNIENLKGCLYGEKISK